MCVGGGGGFTGQDLSSSLLNIGLLGDGFILNDEEPREMQHLCLSIWK